MKNARSRKEKKDIGFHHTRMLFFTVLVVFCLIACIAPLFSYAAASVSEEIPVEWYAKDPNSNQAYCSQMIYYYRSGGNTSFPITSHSIQSSGTMNFNRYFGLLTQSKEAYVPPTSSTNLGSPISSIYWKGGHDTYPYFRYVQLENPFYDFLNASFNMSTSEFGKQDYFVSYVGTAQNLYPTWKSYIDGFEYTSHNDYIHTGYSASRPSLVCLRLFADIPTSVFMDPEYDYINFSYDYTSYFPKFNTWFNSKRDELLSDSSYYTARIGYKSALGTIYYTLAEAESQYTYVSETGRIANDINTTQSIKCNLYDLLASYNDGLNDPLTLDQFVETVPTLTVAITYWHIVYDRVDTDVNEAIMSSQYFCRYALPVVYMSNYNPVTVGFAQVGQQLDQINNTLFLVQDAGDVQIIDNLAEMLDQSQTVVSDYDSAVSALDQIIGSVQPETNVIVNAFSTDPSDTGAGALFSNGFDLKGFMGNTYIMPILLIAVSVSVISWVIYGKRSG